MDNRSIFFDEDPTELVVPDDVFEPVDDGGTPEAEESPKGNFVNTSSVSVNSNNFDDDIYKKWFRSSSKQGFLTVRTWLEAGKVSIDIGDVVNKNTSNTLVWTDAIKLATYLSAVSNGTGAVLYPKGKNDNPESNPESYVYYGGGKSEGKLVSRILKIHYWEKSKDNFDTNAFAFKAGHFKAKEASSGAIIPTDMGNPLSMNMIKVTRQEVAEISYRLNLAISRYVNNHTGDPFRNLNGNAK